MIEKWTSLNFCGEALARVLVIHFLMFVQGVLPGANDLHFHDGASTVDVIAGDIFFEIVDPPELQYSYRIRPAKDFGSPFNESVVLKGVRLVPAVPLDACTQLHNTEDVLGHVAFVERGECSFVLKSRQAELAGARAVIITETLDLWDHSLDHLIEMVDDKMDYDVHIPSAFLLGKSGAAILRTLRRLRLTHATINLPVNMTYVSIGEMNQPPWIGW